MDKLFTKKLLISLYRTMVRIRLCEESLIPPILSGEIKCPVHLYSGQEAIAAGVCTALTGKDYIFGGHRSHGHYLAKGGSLQKLVAEIYCRETGCSRGRGGSMHVIAPESGVLGSAPIVAGTISLAVGAALAAQIRKEKRVSISFFGDGACGEGVLYESLNFAALKHLPVIFVCENNLYSTHMPIKECRPQNNIFQTGIPFGIKSFRADGNNVLKVYSAAQKAVDLCRKGQGPVFLEFLTYRLRGHVGPDDNIQGHHTDIRPEKEVEKWREKDPIIKYGKFLLKNRILSKDGLDQIRSAVEQEVQAAHTFAHQSSFPPEKEFKRHVFKE